MKAKKIISFCSLFSLVLILSVYYVLTPTGVMEQSVSNIQGNDDVNVEVVDGEDAYFKNLDILKETKTKRMAINHIYPLRNTPEILTAFANKMKNYLPVILSYDGMVIEL